MKFRKYLNRVGVRLIFSKSNQKCSTVERFQKTIQRKIYLYITEFETRRFIHVLDKIIEIYNITEHSFLNASPFSVETDKELQYKTMLLHSQKYENVRKRKQRFNVGDVVRISFIGVTISKERMNDLLLVQLI